MTGPCASDRPPDEHHHAADPRLVGAGHLHVGPAGVRRAQDAPAALDERLRAEHRARPLPVPLGGRPAISAPRAVRARSDSPISSGNSSNRLPPGTAFPADELVRSGARAFAEDRLGEHPPATLSPGHIALIKATYRAAHMLTMPNTEQLSQREFDELVGAAHKVWSRP